MLSTSAWLFAVWMLLSPITGGYTLYRAVHVLRHRRRRRRIVAGYGIR